MATRILTPLTVLNARIYPGIASKTGAAAARTKNARAVRVGVLTEKGETSVVLRRFEAARFGLRLVWEALKPSR